MHFRVFLLSVHASVLNYECFHEGIPNQNVHLNHFTWDLKKLSNFQDDLFVKWTENNFRLSFEKIRKRRKSRKVHKTPMRIWKEENCKVMRHIKTFSNAEKNPPLSLLSFPFMREKFEKNCDKFWRPKNVYVHRYIRVTKWACEKICPKCSATFFV
jgi:hypothetical protein